MTVETLSLESPSIITSRDVWNSICICQLPISQKLLIQTKVIVFNTKEDGEKNSFQRKMTSKMYDRDN